MPISAFTKSKVSSGEPSHRITMNSATDPERDERTDAPGLPVNHAAALAAPEIAKNKWDDAAGAGEHSRVENDASMFHQMFERSADAILLFDPAREVFVD